MLFTARHSKTVDVMLIEQMDETIKSLEFRVSLTECNSQIIPLSCTCIRI